jgi:hypothetical protein
MECVTGSLIAYLTGGVHMIELDVVESLLGVPPDYPSWRIADMANRARILPTWLSSVVARGMPISPGASEYLERVRRRVDTLHAVGEELRTRHAVTVIKGERIASRMPAGLLRNSGDADIVAPDQEALWRCVLDLSENRGAVPQGVNILRTTDALHTDALHTDALHTDALHGDALHVVVAMKWPAEEPFLDKPLGADIATCAFCGDMASVPIRVEPLEDDDLCSLFAVAEERFQRKYSRKDMLDLLVLAERLWERFGTSLPELVLGAARRLCLAPELRRLIDKTSEWVDLPDTWLDIAGQLGPLAGEEKAERKSGNRKPPEVLFGFPLDREPSPSPVIELHQFALGEIARTPIGNCLLLAEPNMSEELYAAAKAEVTRWH